MSMNVSPVKTVMSAVSTVAPKSKVSKMMNFSENIMPRKEDRVNPARTIIVKVLETLAEKAKTKPDAERNVIDYIIILADKFKDFNPIVYVS